MRQWMDENNYIQIAGEVSGEISYSHTAFGEKFYEMPVKVMRISGVADEVVITVPEVFCGRLKVESHFEIRGQLRTYSKDAGDHRQGLLRIFAKEVRTEQTCEEGINRVELHGFLCKPPTYRVTPLKREITDLIVAVNRPYGKSDYIPCICWGRTALEASMKKVGDPVHLFGRIQSRKYLKRYPDREKEMVAYELSVTKLFANCDEMILGKED